MKPNNLFKITLGILAFFILSFSFAQEAQRDYYELRIYHIKNQNQENQVDNYLKNALLPALHRNGISKVGVFKPIASQPDAGKKVIVFIPFKNLESYLNLTANLAQDDQFLKSGDAYINAPHDNPPYERIETALLRAFTGMANFRESKVTGEKKNRIYELRSYEAATERLYLQKVKMFNEGEMDIFDKLDFNPIFYAETIAGATMPNLVYMTTFPDMESRDAHWKAFGIDPDWDRMKVMEEYQHTVSKNVTMLLYPTEYSDL